MKLTFMGTGTSQGVPVIAGGKSALDLSNPRNWRMRCCAHLEAGGTHIQIDAGPEFRLQCLQNSIDWIDFFILTHGHADHIAGMDDLRRFCDRMEGNILPVYSNDYGMERVRAMFPYAMLGRPTECGYPCFDLKPMPEMMEVSDRLKVYSESLPHGPIRTLGLVFETKRKKVAYFTDCKMLTPRASELAANADIVAIDCLRPEPHPSHMCVDEAIAAAEKIGAAQSYFIHTTTRIDYGVWEPKMPPRCHLAYDGLVAEI